MSEIDAPKDRSRRIEAIQGARALSVILVLAYHSHLPVSGGFIGVDLFFVISGFVITRLLVRRIEGSGRLRLTDFYKARVRRLLPGLALMLCVVIAASAFVISPIEGQANTAISGIGASVWLANFALYYVTAGYFSPDAHYATLLHTWSLGVEEQFYIVFPLIVAMGYALSRLGRRRGRGPVVFLVLGVFALSFLINLWLCYGQPAAVPAPTGVAFFLPFARAWEFAAGALVALWSSGGRAKESRWSSLLAAFGLFTCVAGALLINDRMLFPGVTALVPVLGASLLLAGLAGNAGGWVGRVLSHRWATVVGDRSYSIYLWHWPFVVFAVTLIEDNVAVRFGATLLSLPVAWLAYAKVEQPIRERGPRKPVIGLVALCVATPIALSIGLLQGSVVAWGNDEVREIRRQIEPHTYVQAACDASRTVRGEFEICHRRGGKGRPVILLGDSNAQQYGNALAEVTAKDRDYLVSVAPGCAMVPIDAVSASGSARCVRRTEALLDWLTTQRPSVVVIASANVLVDDPTFSFSDARGKRATTESEKAEMWERGLRDTFEAIAAMGHEVIQVRAIPHFNDDGVIWSPSRCSMPQLTFSPGSCTETKSVEEGDREHEAGLVAEIRAADAAGVEVLDLSAALCPEGTCAVRDGDFWVYREGMHLTEGMSKRLAPQFAKAIGQ